MTAPALRGELVDHRGRTLEARDPRGATQRIGWHNNSDLPQIDQWNAEQAFRLGYLANVVAYRCVQLRANAIASVPLVAGRKLGDTKTANPNARIAKLLGPPPGGPAPKLSARKLIRWTVAQEIVTGRRAWEIETDDRDVPVAFWPLASSSLQAVPSKGGNDWFRLFKYGRDANGQPITFQPDDVFFGWEPSGTDFRQAESGLQASRYDLSLITLCDRYGISFLRNNAVPAAVVTVVDFPTDEKKRAFERQWSAEFEGVDNAGRTHFNYVSADGQGPVGESIDVKVLGLSAKDARLIETRKAAMVELAISLGVPWSKLDASGRTFDNAEAEDRTYWEETILPGLLDLQDDINMQLAPRLGSDVVWFDLSTVRALRRRVQPVTQSVGVPALVMAQIMQINEGRDDYGLEPVEGGDRFLTAEEIAALSPNAAQFLLGAPEPPALPAPEQKALPPAPPNADDPDLNADEAARAARAETRAVDPELVEQRRTRIWRTADATVRAIEARWTKTMRRLFAKQADATIARLRGKRGRQMLERRDTPDPIDAEELFTLAFWTEETRQIVEGLYEEASVAGLTRLTAAYGIDFDLDAPWAAEFIEQRANQLAGQVTQTTYDAIQAELVAGVAEGQSIDDLADRIRAVFTQASDTRSVTIARTEVISAYNGAATLGAAQLPSDVVAAQEWISTRDGRTREAHASADGQTVGVGTAFEVGGQAMAYPGDPAGGARNTVNCRCTVAFLTPEEWAETQERSARRMDVRVAAALLGLVPSGGEFDFMTWRRAAEEVASDAEHTAA